VVTGDRNALARRMPGAERAWDSLRNHAIQSVHGSSYLLWADLGVHVATDWADQVARRGYATGLEARWYHATRSMALRMLRAIAAGLLRHGNAFEWYRVGGRPSSAAHYQWPARLYLVALYTTYLGLDERWVPRIGRISTISCLDGGTAVVVRTGHRLRSGCPACSQSREWLGLSGARSGRLNAHFWEVATMVVGPATNL